MSLVVTESPLNFSSDKSTARISKIIDDSIKYGRFNVKQKDIISKIKDSIYSIPQASEQAQKYTELLDITYDNNYIIPNEQNKITVDGENSTHVSNFINAVNREIQISISELNKAIRKKWQDEKKSVFKYIENAENSLSLKNVLPTPDKLTQLIKIINIESSSKTVENFLEIIKELNLLLEIPESQNKLENLLNYLKYFSNIKFFEEKNLCTINLSKWFNDLFSNIIKDNVKGELLESFKNTMHNDQYSFYNKLNEVIEKCYQDIKNNNILDSQAIQNIYNLRNFLLSIKKIGDQIKNLDDIEPSLINSFKNIPNINGMLHITIHNSIDNLKKLIGSISEQEVKYIWKNITLSESTNEINKNFNAIIYDKLLHTPILANQEQHTYNLLKKLLIASHKSTPVQQKQEELYKFQLAEICCQHAQILNINSTEAINLYKEAITLGSAKANIQLGKIFSQRKNEHVEGLKYLKETTCITIEGQAFKKFMSEKIKKPHTNRELAKEYLKQAKYYEKNDLIEKAKKAYLNAIGQLEEKLEHEDYLELSNTYAKLAEIASPRNQAKFHTKAKEYMNLAKEFNTIPNLKVIDSLAHTHLSSSYPFTKNKNDDYFDKEESYSTIYRNLTEPYYDPKYEPSFELLGGDPGYYSSE